ncbi:MMPL family transporter [Streptomyces sp. MJP52]|uniref:MMPL family transporter n=1 Tax=Streptomyces sp. MJP52 TaxID=2940555 RepID=UPI002473499F|nr:MMPL family transporter [Streptomyces sp. MJP52]MDH6227211.1 RND superfamily putative drug exporter [Streptomyces sp. MJP52]
METVGGKTGGPRPRQSRRQGARDPVLRGARLVVAGALLALVCAGLLVPGALAALDTGGAAAAGTEAGRAVERAERLGVAAPDLVLVVTGREPSSVAAGARAVAGSLAGDPAVRRAWTAGDSPADPARSPDGTLQLVPVRMTGDATGRKEAAPGVLAAARAAAPQGVRVEASGPVWAGRELGAASAAGLARAELIAAPLVFAVLVFAYGSVVSALLPVAVAVLTVVCSIPVIGLLARFFEVSSFAVNAAAAVGFGLAVDYTLFLLARVKEHTGRGEDLESALAAARRSSGRSIVFSAAAVACCMACALVVPVPLLRALALAGATATVLAAVVALTVLPSCLRLLGDRVDRFDPLWRWRRARTGDDSRFWRRTSLAVTARPWLAGSLATLVLVVLAAPVVQARFGLSDERSLPASAQAARTQARVDAELAVPPERMLTVVLTGVDRPGAMGPYLDRLRGVGDVRWARPAATGRGERAGGVVLAVALDVAPDSDRAREALDAVRAVPAPGEVVVGGRAAEIADTNAAVREALPRCLLLLAAALTLLLGYFTRSWIAPLKALAVAVLSLGASIGAVVWMFQEGRMRWLVGGFTVTGTLDASLLLFTLFVALALSVDYEVFLLGRIREEFDRCGDNRRSVVDGIARTARLLTSAAAAVAISTAAMASAQVTTLKLIGVGIALAAVVDAVLVRGVLVPAVMAVLGPANWWSPYRSPRPGAPAAPPEREPAATAQAASR